jgi:hypothetical protein
MSRDSVDQANTASFAAFCAIALFASCDAALAGDSPDPKAAATAPPAAASATPLCFGISHQCLQPRRVASPVPATEKKALDLRAPDIRRLIAPSELQTPLMDPYEARAAEPTVQVEAKREYQGASVGIMALPWAIRHPTQAWRIFLPMPADSKP